MKKSILLLLVFFYLLPLRAQDMLWGLQFKSGIATQDFHEVSGRLVVPELAVFTNYQVPNLPFEVGVSLGFGLYGTQLEKRNDLYVGFNDELRLRRNNNTLSMAGVFRFFPQVYGKVFPFMEAQIGALYGYTRFKIREDAFSEPIELERDMGNWTRLSQLGGGVMIPLGSEINANLELRLMYQNTGRLEYLTKGDVNYVPDPDGQVNGTFEYSPRRSTFNMIQPSIGLSFYFD
ncbi:hypothetical protein MM236_14035 [Belliella sp. DSM 107340]|uniref:Outer membrane protein beta-barrel domain-containing protein n=1 Tax=Belliella calami TaxID=2923436 RepID=A0ABS9URS6_9BACT|nr:hypothetical protein [Belliella calami]MCH7399120.1 hypothetical protein [Belliella calami]